MRRGPLAATAVRSARAALLAAAVLAAVATAAGAAPTWLAPFDALPQPAAFVQPAMNAGGEILFVDRSDVGGGKFAFRVAAREPGAGGVGAPVLFPPAGSATLAPVPSLALADDGHAILAWYDAGVAYYALRAPDGTWGAATALPGSANVTAVVAGIDGSGRATLGWAENTNPSAMPGDPTPNVGTVKVVRISPGGSVSGSQTLLSPPAGSAIATVASLRVVGSGAAVFLYGTTSIFLFGDQTIAFRDAPTGNFGDAIDLGSTALFGGTTAIGDSGRSAYAQVSGTDIALRVRDPGSALAPATNVGAGGSAANVRVGLAGDGGITVAWDVQSGGDPRIMACTIAGGDCAGDPQRLSAPTSGGGSISLSSLAVDGAGAALAAWNDFESSPAPAWHVKTAWRPAGAGAAFGPEQDLATPPAQNPTVALDADGDGVATYNAATGGTNAYRAIGLDAAGPRIDAFSAPASVAQGAVAGFGAGASDVWSPFGLAWSFGDGSAGAAGPSVSHAFGAPGAFRVTVTATDAAGNSSSRSAVVLVRDTVSPRVERLALTHARFRVGRGATARVAAATAARAARRRVRTVPRGTTIRYMVSEASVATFAVERVAAGRRVGRACRKPSRANRRHRRCTRLAAVGRLVRHARAGANALAFSGRIGRKALAPGRYRLTLTLRDPAGNASGPKSIAFTIVR